MITVWIDELTHCLKDARTGEIIPTEVIKITRKSFLKKFNKRNGWATNWAELIEENEIYALVVEGTVDIQGLVAIAKNDDVSGVYVAWMVAAPENNKLHVDDVRYLGVGGHLFAIAVQKSIEYGYDGDIYGFAANRKLLEHYMKVFNAQYIGMFHEYHFAIVEDDSRKIVEVYDYEWTDEQI